MPLIFQDWSKLVSKVEIQKRYEAKGWKFPEQGRYLVKVYPLNRHCYPELEKWAEVRELRIHYSKHPHIDLYGPNLEYAAQENILNSDEVKKLIKQEFFNSKESSVATKRNPETL